MTKQFYGYRISFFICAENYRRQKEEVLRRQSYVKNHPEALMDFDEMMIALKKNCKITVKKQVSEIVKQGLKKPLFGIIRQKVVQAFYF